MEQEKGNFRGKMFGGFCRQDVIDYIEELATERNKLQRENQELREHIWELEEKLEAVPALTAPAETAPGETAGEQSGQVPDAAPAAETRTREETERALTEARELLRSVRASYDALCTDVKINAAQAEGELRTISSRLTGIQNTLRSAGERLEQIGRRLEDRED